MQNPENEFDTERIKIYVSETTEAKLRYLESAIIFFDSVKDEKAKEIDVELKTKGF